MEKVCSCVCPTHVCALVAGAVLLSLPLLLLLLQLLDALFQDVGPEVALKVRQLLGAGQPVLRSLLEDVLKERKSLYQGKEETFIYFLLKEKVEV